MGCGVNHDWCYCPQNPRIYLMVAVFSLTGYLGINFVLVLVNSFGALTAVTGETEMKVCMERTGGCWCCWWLEATSACERVMCLCVVDILIRV